MFFDDTKALLNSLGEWLSESCYDELIDFLRDCVGGSSWMGAALTIVPGLAPLKSGELLPHLPCVSMESRLVRLGAHLSCPLLSAPS